jgi:hypothetical protein
MIEISNFLTATEGWTFGLVLNGRALNGCRAVDVRGRLQAILPQSAGGLDWGDESQP